MKPLHTLAAALMFLLPACTINSTNVSEPYRPENDPAYVSPLQYADYTCNQLHTAMDLVSAKLSQSMRQDNTQKALDTAMAAFAVAQGQAYNPPSREAPPETLEQRRLKNEYSVIEQTAIKKDCITVHSN